MRLAIAALAVIATACDPGEVDLRDRACPCIGGWVCDMPTMRCVEVGADASSMDAALPDGAPPMDARVVRDGGPLDAPEPPFDAGPRDAGPSDGGPTDAGPPPLEPPWWDVAWGHRARFTITNTASVDAPAALPVVDMIDLTALPTSPARGNVRVVRWDASDRTWSMLDYAADSTPPSISDAPVWFPLVVPVAAGAMDDSYWLYWDNPAATEGRSPNRVFTAWESFFALPSSGWVIEAPVSVNAAAELVLSRGGSIRSATRWGPGFAVDFMMTVPTFSAYFWGGYQREADFVDGDPWLIWINRDWDTGRIWPEVKISAIGHAAALEGTHLTIDGSRHHYSVERYDDHAVFVRDYAAVSTVDFGASYANPLQVRLRSSPATGPEMRIDWVRVRPVIEPMPAVTLGAPEARP